VQGCPCHLLPASGQGLLPRPQWLPVGIRSAETDRRDARERPDQHARRCIEIHQDAILAASVLDVMTRKISVSGVSKTYNSDAGEVLALQNTGLEVKEGEFVSLVGPSGCGKSTLLYIVGGFLAAKGKVLIDDKAVEGPGVERGIVFQEYALFPWLTVRRNILYA